MFCLNKRQCHSVILFSLLHIYTGDAEQRRLTRQTHIWGCMLLILILMCEWGQWTWWEQPVWFLQVSPLKASGNAKLSFSHAKSDLTEELCPEIYAIIHAANSVLSAVKVPWLKEGKTRLMHFWTHDEHDKKLKTEVLGWTWCDAMTSGYWWWKWRINKKWINRSKLSNRLSLTAKFGHLCCTD